MPTPQQLADAVSDLPNVGILVYLAFQWDSVDEQQYTTLIFKSMREAYEDELTRQAAAVGCPGRVGRLREGQELTELKQVATMHAQSIVRTHNYDLAKIIVELRINNPRGNRFYYSKYVREWEATRATWKDKQIALMTVQTGRQRGREAFILNNPVTGKAYFEPRQAAEAECQALVAGSPWSIEKVYSAPTPIHFNCIHSWRVKYSRIPKDECALLWMG